MPPVFDDPVAERRGRRPQQHHQQQRSPRSPELQRSPPTGIKTKTKSATSATRRSAAQPARAGRRAPRAHAREMSAIKVNAGFKPLIFQCRLFSMTR
jgi:hypothetical protein